MKAWIPREIDVEGINVEIREADATLEVDYIWDDGATDANGRQCSPAEWLIESVEVASININGRERSREWLCDICGADAVEATEEWLRDNLDARQIAADEAQAYADAKADYAAEIGGNDGCASETPSGTYQRQGQVFGPYVDGWMPIRVLR